MHVRFRDYEAGDDEACKRLERTASQFTFGFGLFAAAIVHYGSFDAKVRQFGRSLCLVCCLEEDDTVCGVIAVAIKEAWVHGAMRTVGYVFDLRIDGRYQGHGLGKRLAREAERRSEQEGCDLLYLSVNGDNVKALRLYAGLGWVRATPRRLSMRPLLLPPPSAPLPAGTGPVRRLAADEAAEMTSAHFAARDLGPSRREWARLFASPLYLGTFSLRHR